MWKRCAKTENVGANRAVAKSLLELSKSKNGAISNKKNLIYFSKQQAKNEVNVLALPAEVN